MRQAWPEPSGHAPSPRRFRNLGFGPLDDSSGLRPETQRVREGPEDTPTPCRRARWRIWP
eukprot:1881760-Pyramimonas_sp.AAC.1